MLCSCSRSCSRGVSGVVLQTPSVKGRRRVRSRSWGKYWSISVANVVYMSRVNCFNFKSKSLDFDIGNNARASYKIYLIISSDG